MTAAHRLVAGPGRRGPELVDEVLAHHRARLLDYADRGRADQRFVAGLAWGLYALERVDRALAGTTDRAALGFDDLPRMQPPLPPRPPREAPVRTIHRYALPIRDRVEVITRAGAQLLAIAPARDGSHRIDLWALVDTTAPGAARRIAILGTGQPAADDIRAAAHLGTVASHEGHGIWHVFDLGQEHPERVR